MKQDDQPAEARHWKHQKPMQKPSPAWLSRGSEILGYLHTHPPALSAVKVLLLALIFHAYNYKPYLHPCLVWGLYCLHAFLKIQLVLAANAVPARLVLGGLGLELEPQFKEPYLTTSLEDFWGRRWNLTVSGILRLTIYNPLRRVCVPIMGPELGSYAAVVAAFTVSGLMHEALFYCYTRADPTWEVTAFFTIQGVCVVIEKAARKRFRNARHGVSAVLTLGFLSASNPVVRTLVDEARDR